MSNLTVEEQQESFNGFLGKSIEVTFGGDFLPEECNLSWAISARHFEGHSSIPCVATPSAPFFDPPPLPPEGCICSTQRSFESLETKRRFGEGNYLNYLEQAGARKRRKDEYTRRIGDNFGASLGGSQTSSALLVIPWTEGGQLQKLDPEFGWALQSL